MNLYLSIAIVAIIIISFITGLMIGYKGKRKLDKRIVELELNMLSDQDEISSLKSLLGQSHNYEPRFYDENQIHSCPAEVSSFR